MYNESHRKSLKTNREIPHYISPINLLAFIHVKRSTRMVQYFFKRAAVLTVLAAVVIASSCNPNMRPTQDTTAPAEVTELKAATSETAR